MTKITWYSDFNPQTTWNERKWKIRSKYQLYLDLL